MEEIGKTFVRVLEDAGVYNARLREERHFYALRIRSIPIDIS